MRIESLLPDPPALQLEQYQLTLNRITIKVRCSSPAAKCPLCGHSSSRVHGRYTRTLKDLPWHGRAVQLRLLARKFFCNTPGCPRRIFVERLPKVGGVFSRATCRLAETRGWIGFALGGEAGSRLAGRLGMTVSPDTLLRMIRSSPPPLMATPRALGIDDWAVRRGRRYGTLLCDLHRHCPVDMLEDREADTLAAWLRAHPGIRIITRDRAHFYKEGVSAGAPRAIQVTDRFHLMQNLRNVLFKILERHHRAVAVAVREATPNKPPIGIGPGSGQLKSRFRQPRVPRLPTRREIRRERRFDRYRHVMELHQQGMSDRSVARQLGINRETVARYVQAGRFPERIPRRQSSQTDPFIDYLRRRWHEGCHNAAQLTREIQEQGFTGSYLSVRRRVAHWEDVRTVESADGCTPDHPAIHPPSARRLSWLLLKEPSELDAGNRSMVDAVLCLCPEVGKAAALARDFASMVRHQTGQNFDAWIRRAWDRSVPRELRLFATGLKSDYDAVKAALTTRWSNGQVEGQVNRLKLIKRQMYGRAKFDLLRQRVLHAG